MNFYCDFCHNLCYTSCQSVATFWAVISSSIQQTLNFIFHSKYLVCFFLGSFTLNFGLKYEIIYQLDAIEYLFVFFQLDMFRAYMPIFRSNGCYKFFTYAAYEKTL